MFERFTDRARKIMALANQEAQRFNHEYVGTEHILLGMVKEGTGVGAQVLKNLKVDLRRVRRAVEKLVKAGPEMVTMGKLPQTPRARKVVEYAIEESRNLNHNYLGSEHLLLGLLREYDGVGATVLRKLGVRLAAAREGLLDVIGSCTPEDHEAEQEEESPILKRNCALCARVRLIESGSDESVVAELLETFVVLSENQGCPGWCVLILKQHANHLAELDLARQARVWIDVSLVAGAIRRAFPKSGKRGGPPRINYECLGNLVPHIHWHVIPRHANDPAPTKPVWVWSKAKLKGRMSGPKRLALIQKLRKHL